MDAAYINNTIETNARNNADLDKAVQRTIAAAVAAKPANTKKTYHYRQKAFMVSRGRCWLSGTNLKDGTQGRG
jgi:hypothetical protein